MVTKPDYVFWDGIPTLKVYQAAYLWNDLEPEGKPYKEYPEKVKAIITVIGDAILTPERCQIYHGAGIYSAGTYGGADVTRQELLSLSDHLNQKPKFLYPESRNERTSAPPQGIHPDLSDLSTLELSHDGLGVMSLGVYNEMVRENGQIQVNERLIESNNRLALALQESNLTKLPKKADSALDPRERETLLIIMAALCEKANVSPEQRGLSVDLATVTERLGTPRSSDTILRYLKEAAEATR